MTSFTADNWSYPQIKESHEKGLLTIRGRYRNFTIRWQDLLNLYFFVCIWLIIVSLTNTEQLEARATALIGGLSMWRYGWWLTNFCRAVYFGRIKYPRMRKMADAAWNEGWRPHRMHFIMTTFHEKAATTKLCLKSIVDELRACNVPGTLWVGTGAVEDEIEIRKWFATAPDVELDVVLLRQNMPGKRCALATALRGYSRHGAHANDLVVMMDGDSIFIDGCLKKCISLFGAYPALKALTTDEDAICYGPAWTQKWLTMRFAQRRMWMQSHAVSGRVLTLTGRMSVFRAQDTISEEFISVIESDYLNHWFWGQFRFLSGDDKSSWYCLLKRRSEMTFVPDAMVYTIEYIEGSAIKRARDNLLRWSGNMLRNGLRAIALGPRVVPPFIWWCLIDQRLAIWSTLAGVLIALSMSSVSPSYIFVYLAWILGSRFFMSSAMFVFSDRIHMSYPIILYFNQLTLAVIKVYLWFRLPVQRWANRLDQKSGVELSEVVSNKRLALCFNVFSLGLLLFVVLLFEGLLQWPSFMHIL